MKKTNITAIFGTRPEAIKMCPLIKELKSRDIFNIRVCLTGQHGNMVKDTLERFGLTYDADLNIMTSGQTLFDITEKALKRIKTELIENPPRLVLVHGDTTSAFAAALSAFYLKIPIGHVEAGLRTGNIYSPFPEEFNRKAIDSISSLCFCPTENNLQNLLSEGKSNNSCFITGNTAVDAIKHTVRNTQKKPSSPIRILRTVHRRESLGEPIKSILRGVRRAALKYNNAEITFPVHPNPTIKDIVNEVLSPPPSNIRLTPPMDVFSFHRALASSHIVLTDSGGIQEEAAALHVPIILARDCTERIEISSLGGMISAGTDEDKIFDSLCRLIEDPDLRERMSSAKNPFGDGSASIRIADIISREFA